MSRQSPPICLFRFYDNYKVLKVDWQLARVFIIGINILMMCCLVKAFIIATSLEVEISMR